MKNSITIFLFLVSSSLLNFTQAKNIEKPCKKTKHYIGQFYGGGIIFYLYKDNNGIEHGLIASLSDQSKSCLWGFYGVDIPNCNSSWDGASNTHAFIAAAGKPEFAVGICAVFNGKGYTDWYLPSIDELNLLFNARFVINKTLEEDNDPSTEGLEQRYYWSSSQNSASHAWYWNAGAGFADDGSKNNLPSPHVRAIRSF